MNTFWGEAGTTQRFPALDKDIKRDIVVIGGGIAGLLTAFFLSEEGRQVTLLEAATLYSGTTRNTTAHITALQGYIYADLAQKGKELAKLYYRSQQDAIEKYKHLIKKYNIDCDFVTIDDCIYETGEPAEGLKKEYDTLKEAGAPVELTEGGLLHFEIKDGFRLPEQAVFNPLKFLEGLPREFEIFEDSRVVRVDIKNKTVFTEKCSVQADIIIIATGFPIVDIPGWHFLRMYKSTSYALAIKTDTPLKYTLQGAPDDGLTFRPAHSNRVIIGGLGHRTGRMEGEDKYERLEEIACKNFAHAEVVRKWSANDCMTFDNVPLAGAYSKTTEGIYLITGFNKWGMANSMICSSLLCGLITGRENEYKDLFSPQRTRGNVKGVLSNTAELTKDLALKPLTPRLKTARKLSPGEGDIISYKGGKKAAYMDEEGRLHLVDPLCAHLRCRLSFNPVERTWDCPCHGSRFDIDGRIIVSPAVYPLRQEIEEEDILK